MDFLVAVTQANGGRMRGAPAALARAVGISAPSVSDWLARKSRPDERHYPKIAQHLGVHVDELKRMLALHFASGQSNRGIREESVQYNAVPGPSIIHVPVVGTAGADGFDFSFDAPVEEYLPVVVEGPAGRRFAALKVVGKCMEPTLREGEYVIVAAAETVPDGKLGVFRLDGGCTIKRPFRHDGHVELRPDNPDPKYKPIKLATNKLEVVGIVVGFFRKP